MLTFALLLAGLDASGMCAGTVKGVPGAPIAIENRGRQSIYNLYASPAGKSGWGCDRLDDFTIPASGNRTIAIAHPRGLCLYRLKLVLADKGERVRKVDVCRGGRWVVTAAGEWFEAPAAD